MKQKFTQDQLIQFLYKETDAAQSLTIAEQLSADPVLLAEYEELLEASQQLPKVQFRPSKETISDILQYSEMSTLEASH